MQNGMGKPVSNFQELGKSTVAKLFPYGTQIIVLFILIHASIAHKMLQNEAVRAPKIIT
jgi:hypothetical protein